VRKGKKKKKKGVYFMKKEDYELNINGIKRKMFVDQNKVKE